MTDNQWAADPVGQRPAKRLNSVVRQPVNPQNAGVAPAQTRCDRQSEPYVRQYPTPISTLVLCTDAAVCQWCGKQVRRPSFYQVQIKPSLLTTLPKIEAAPYVQSTHEHFALIRLKMTLSSLNTTNPFLGRCSRFTYFPTPLLWLFNTEFSKPWSEQVSVMGPLTDWHDLHFRDNTTMQSRGKVKLCPWQLEAIATLSIKDLSERSTICSIHRCNLPI